MQLKIKLFILTILTSLAGFTQTSKIQQIEGFVINAKTLEPIPFANIGILQTEIGTLSNEDGSFSIKIPEKYHDKHLLFSSIGYQKSSIQINSIKPSKSQTIMLKELPVRLEEITVTTEKFKKQKEIFGNGKSLLLNGVLKGDSVNAGAALALLIDKRKYPDLTYIQHASLHIAINLMPRFKMRMRLMEIDSANGLKPGDDIIYEQLIEESSIKKGWLDFSIPASLQIEQDAFYLVFEWILTRKERVMIDELYAEYYELYPDKVRYDTILIDGEEIVSRIIPRAISGTYLGVTSTKGDRSKYVCYERGNSFGEWKRSSDILSARIEFTNYPAEQNQKEDQATVLSVTESITQWAESFNEEQQIPGFQLAVAKDDNLIYSGAFGLSDQDAGINATSTTQFRIASISKPLTSAGVMKLVSQNKLDLNQTVRHYFPEFPEKKYPITIGQLLGHLGGLRDYYGISWEDELFIQEHYANTREAVSLFKNDTLVAEPGTAFVYSPFGYVLLGAVIEKVTGQSYLQYMQNEIWKPLDMNLTYGDIADSTMANKSKFYFFSGDEAPHYDMSYKYPSGGIVSTSEDLVRFGSALLAGSLLDASFIEQTFTEQSTASGEYTGYGLGWYIGKDANDRRIWYHAGESPEASSMLLMYPEQKLVIALLANAPIISDSEDGFSESLQNLVEIMLSRENNDKS